MHFKIGRRTAKSQETGWSSLSAQDGLALLLCWVTCAGLTGIVLFEPLRELLEPVILTEAAERIESKIKLTEIALESRKPEELPSSPEVVVGRWPNGASNNLNENDKELIRFIASHEGMKRAFLVATPNSTYPAGGYWIKLEVPNKTEAFWLYSRNSLALSSWFLPVWRTVLLCIGVLIGTLIFLRWRLTRPLNIAIKKMSEEQGNHLTLMKPEGLLPVRRLTAQVNKLYEQINASTATRLSILRSITHDLRSPLCRLQLLAELGEPIEPEQLRGNLNLLATLAEQISSISEDSDSTEVSETFLLEPFLQRIASSYSGKDVEVEEANWILTLDQKYLERTLFNLIDNALEYGAAPVRIVTKRTKTSFEISVEDSGVGTFTPSLLTMPHITRSNDRGQQRHSGLGLQIAESFCRNHGGKLVLGQKRGGGARVELRLPTSCAASRNR